MVSKAAAVATIIAAAGRLALPISTASGADRWGGARAPPWRCPVLRRRRSRHLAHPSSCLAQLRCRLG
eukprot:11616860-Alexandrium_andersonii.AAC.1